MAPTREASSKCVSSQKRKGRGQTRCLYLRQLGDGEKFKVRINHKGQAIGKHASKLTNYCGILARDWQKLSLDSPSWDNVNAKVKDLSWKAILEKFDIDERLRDFAMKSIAKKWRDYKCYLKANHFTRHSTDEERINDCPEQVVKDQWEVLIHYWNSEEGKRAKSESQKSPTRAELFVITHKRKDGTPINNEVAEKMVELDNILSEDINQDSYGPNDAFSKLFGKDKRGHVRGYGLGPTPTSLWGSTSNCNGSCSASANDEIVALKERMQLYEEREKIREKETEEYRATIQALMRQVGCNTSLSCNASPSTDSLNTTNL